MLGIERSDTAALPAPSPAASVRPASPAKKRLKIWQIPSGWLCSVVGTCLSSSDVERIVRRCGLAFPDGVETYDIHGFMVARASERGRVAREITRTLDDRHAAILRQVGAERDQARLAALWDDLCGRGLIAGAYWAIMSHSHVAEPLKMHAFGEVHMLSHFMGGCNRHNALPDRLREPSGLPPRQGAVPAAGQTVRAVAQQQRHLLRACHRGLADAAD
jgi:hypothetical protein